MTIASTNFSAVDSEIGWAANSAIDMNWVKGNSKDALANLGGVLNRAWYQNNTAGNCNNGNCNCTTHNFVYTTYNYTTVCNCATVGNCVNCANCSAVNCANCDSRAWLQGNCNCACTYNCNPTGTYTNNCNCDCACAQTCFVAGSLVLMPDWSWKRIEQIHPGEYIMGMDGPTQVIKIDIPVLGNRQMLRFSDGSLTWSEEHCFWAKQEEKEWFWSANPSKWLEEFKSGDVVGLKDNSSLLHGPNIEFATLNGFEAKEIELVDAQPETLLFLPVTTGSPIIINGYVVAASVNEFCYDYTKLSWLEKLNDLRNPS